MHEPYRTPALFTGADFASLEMKTAYYVDAQGQVQHIQSGATFYPSRIASPLPGTRWVFAHGDYHLGEIYYADDEDGGQFVLQHNEERMVYARDVDPGFSFGRKYGKTIATLRTELSDVDLQDALRKLHSSFEDTYPLSAEFARFRKGKMRSNKKRFGGPPLSPVDRSRSGQAATQNRGFTRKAS